MKILKLVFIFLFVCIHLVNAQKYNKVQTLQNSALTIGATVSVQSERYSELKQVGNPDLATSLDDRKFIYENPYALLKLSIPQRADNPASGEVAVELLLTYEYELNGQFFTKQEPINLAVKITEASFVDIDYIKVDNAVSAQAEVVAVSGLSQFPQVDLSLACHGIVHHLVYPSDSVSGIHYTAPATKADGSLSDGSLYVSWDGPTHLVNGQSVAYQPDSYELEWTYISHQSENDLATFDKEKVVLRDYLFRNNSTRISTVNQGYFIPLLYEKGVVVFRVRAVGKNTVNGKLVDVKGEWSVIENQTSLVNVPDAYIFKFNGLETNLNWQSSIVFTEEGRNKAVVSYHDGSLRNRQAVTKINSDDRAIVGETYYDYNGRPVINTLPVPVEGSEETNYHYRPQFNVAEGKNTINKTDYDIADLGAGCVPITPELDTASGASKYYSENNKFQENGNTGQNLLNKNLLPDAKQYPYSQIYYTNDNTGRVAYQSGVGDAHNLGSGHETKHLYGAPLQAEISRLFGNQIGVSGHYKKNAVIDPNGQLSVSYLDLNGKVVATALAGGNATGLDDLPGENTRPIVSSILTADRNKLDSDLKGKTMIYPFPVTTSTAYTFNYDLTAGTHTVSCKSITSSDSVQLQLAGVFDATLSLYDKCNSVIFSETTATTVAFGEAVGEQHRNINKIVAPELLPIGQYRLVKKVRINESKLSTYLEEYLSNNNYTCVLKDNDFLMTAYDSIDFGGCGLTCSECNQRIQTLIDELESLNGDESLPAEEKARLFERCEIICLENTTCVSALYGMLASMAPDGQYGQVREKNLALSNLTSMDSDNLSAELDVDSKNFEVEIDSVTNEPSLSFDPAIVPWKFHMSIFNSNNKLMPNLYLRSNGNNFSRATWKRPIRVDVPGKNVAENFKNQFLFTENLQNATYTETNYANEDGSIAYAYITKIGDNEYSPSITSASGLIAEDIATGLYKIPLKHLADVRVFLRYWKTHFANYLVPYHPEFGYYRECTSRPEINDYEETLINVNAPEDGLGKYVASEVISGETYYVTSVLQNDPLFNSASVPQELKDLLTFKVNNYFKKKDQNGDPFVPNQYYSMAEFATVLVNCPNPNAACKNANCDSGKFKAENIEEWTSFKALYLSERQKIVKELSTKNAIQGRYYNGCIGNSAFRGSIEQKRLLTKYDSVPGLVEWQNRINAYCDGWTYFRENHCNYLNGGNYQERILRRLNAIPLYDGTQTCNTTSSYLYDDKIRSFYPSIPDGATDGGPSQVCYETVVDVNGNAQYIETECNFGLLNQGDAIANQAAIRSYQSCGNCPIVSQIEEFLKEVLEAQVLDGQAANFNCFTSIPNLNLGVEFNTIISTAFNDNTQLSWSGDYNTATKMLEGEIIPSPLTGNNKVTVHLDFSDSGIPALDNVLTASEIFERMQIASITTDPTVNNKFILKAFVNLNRSFPSEFTALTQLLADASSANFYPQGANKDENSVYRYEFQIEGTLVSAPANGSGSDSPIDLQTCAFDPICVTTTYPKNVLALLNTLTYVDDTEYEEGIPLKPYDLYPQTTPLEMEDADVYEESIRYLLGFTQEDVNGAYVNELADYAITWSSSLSGLELIGNLNYTLGSQNKKWIVSVVPRDFTGITNTVDFTKINYFTNIRPYTTSCTVPGICLSNKFFADAVITETVDGNPDAYVYHPVVISVNTETGGNSDANQPIATQCEKVDVN